MKAPRLRSIAIAIATFAAMSGSTLAANKVDATFGSIFAPKVPLVGCGAIPMSEDKALKDAGFNLKVIHSAQLGSENQLAEQVSSGQLEMATITSSILAAWLDELAVLETYYLYDNVDQVMKVYRTPTVQAMLNKLLEVANIRVIGNPWLYGERHVFGKRNIKSSSDFKGMRLRVPEAFVSIEGAKSLGAQPTPVAYSELYIALQQGIVDGAEAPIAVIEAESFDEPAEFLALTRHLITAQPFIVNEDFWKSLSPAQQEALTKAANEGSKRVLECAQKADQAALDQWVKTGKVTVISDLNREEIKANSQAYFSKGLPISEAYKNILADLKK